MSDTLLRGLARNGNIRVLMISSKDLVQEAKDIHDLYPTVSAAVGRTMNASLMMAHMLKEEGEKIIVEIRGNGPLSFLLVNADNKGHVRASVSNPHIHQIKEENGKLDVGGIIGEGTLKVIRERDGVAVYNSFVPLQSGEIGDDFAYYFAQSEQIPSVVSLGVLVNQEMDIIASGGLIIQVLPSATEEDIIAMETLVSSLKPMTSYLQDMTITDLFGKLFPDGELLETKDIHYHCGCNRDQMHKVLTTLGIQDIKELIEQDQGATLECHYCHKKYVFTEEDLLKIIEKN